MNSDLKPSQESSANLLTDVLSFPTSKRREYTRTFYRLMEMSVWKKEFSITHMKRMVIANTPKKIKGDFGSYNWGFSKGEKKVLLALCDCSKHCRKGRVTVTFLNKSLKMDYSHLRRVIRDLAECGIVINLGTETAVNIAICPIMGWWRLRKVPELRRARNAKNRRGRKLNFSEKTNRQPRSHK